MGYYDDQVAYYDSQIRYHRQLIDGYHRQIKQMEDDIEDLYRVKAKIGNVESAMAEAEAGTSRKIFNLPGAITNPFSRLKTGFFDRFLDVVKGGEHSKAKNGIESANWKIDSKIRELRREMEKIKAAVIQCDETVSTITRQRSVYIIAKETAEQKAVTAKKPDNVHSANG